MKNSEIIREALEYLEDGRSRNRPIGKHTHVCDAIAKAANINQCYQSKYPLERWISKLLKGWHTYEGWLYAYHGVKYEASREFGIKTQHSRREWVLWMITYWENTESMEEL